MAVVAKHTVRLVCSDKEESMALHEWGEWRGAARATAHGASTCGGKVGRRMRNVNSDHRCRGQSQRPMNSFFVDKQQHEQAPSVNSH